MTGRHTADSITDDALDALYAERDQARTALGDILSHFVHKGHPGEPCLSSGWVGERTVARWRAVLRPPAEPTPAEEGVADRQYWNTRYTEES
ncbi:hypothetical protein [Streptomyces uncialis]|uniref:Uncharacterized protein n=1 Tax=Streptomyces uncialis TaxID=1048205 RepID=A0A1Q4V0Y2_9ACTN|nr:hypothetical protein [Streptomyces uncialis]OKH91471.1 hypothetical protein AB852_28335 [Streptomyces uncialis]